LRGVAGLVAEMMEEWGGCVVRVAEVRAKGLVEVFR
jgi:hypothetical protein